MRIYLEEPLQCLRLDQIALIDTLLHEVAPFGEVRLQLQSGEIRVAKQSKSYDAYKLSRPLSLRKWENEEGR